METLVQLTGVSKHYESAGAAAVADVSMEVARGEPAGELLLELNSAGQTLIVITHNPELAARYSGRVIEIVDGRVASDAPQQMGTAGAPR